MRKGMSRVSSNVLTDGGDISHNIMPQRQLPSSVTEAKLNFYDNLLTITFTETQSQILILFANVLSPPQAITEERAVAMGREKFPKWK